MLTKIQIVLILNLNHTIRAKTKILRVMNSYYNIFFAHKDNLYLQKEHK